jgi:hypothetical protein
MNISFENKVALVTGAGSGLKMIKTCRLPDNFELNFSSVTALR